MNTYGTGYRQWWKRCAVGMTLLPMWAAGAVPMVAWAAEPVTVTATVDHREVSIGERIRYVVSAEHPADVRVAFAPIGSTVGELAVEQRGASSDQRRQGFVVTERWYRLASYQTGQHAIPAAAVTYRDHDGTQHEARGEAITITVKSVLPKDWQSQDIRALKPLVPTLGDWWWVLLVLALMGATAGCGAWWWKRRLAVVASGPPPKPPHEMALEELAALRRDDLLARQRHEEYYVRLSAIVRRYIEGRFSVRAPEMTTEEFLQAAADPSVAFGRTSSEFHTHPLAFERRQLLQEFLMHCDLVKFARYQPSLPEAEQMWEAARRFVEETEVPGAVGTRTE